MSNQEPSQEDSTAQRISNEPDRLLPGLPVAGFTPITELPKMSAVILNWSRFSNLLIIVASLSRIEGIDEILIWNNSARKRYHEGGAFRLVENVRSDALGPGLQGHWMSSPSTDSLQFRGESVLSSQVQGVFNGQIRVLPHPGIHYPPSFDFNNKIRQDDDYLIRPEVVTALRHYADSAPIHLLPPPEHLSTQLRHYVQPPLVDTSFAWLGYGTLVRREQAKEFLTLLKEYDLNQAELRMSDNYFTILRNAGMPTIWFDEVVELGGGQPFTVGSEGNEHNWQHIERALELLLLKSRPKPELAPHPNLTDRLAYAPCIGGRPAVLTTNIRLIPEFGLPLPSVCLREIEAHRIALVGSCTVETYVNHPFSHAVDGKDETFFRSTESVYRSSLQFRLRLIMILCEIDARVGEFLRIHVLSKNHLQTSERLRYRGSQTLANGSELQISEDGATWVGPYVSCDQADVSLTLWAISSIYRRTPVVLGQGSPQAMRRLNVWWDYLQRAGNTYG